MGFLDKVKGLANRVTGGYGDITFNIEKDTVSPGEDLNISINIAAKSDLKAKALLVRLRGYEEVRVNVQHTNQDGSTSSSTQTVREETLSQEYNISGELEIKGGESRDFQGAISIPSDAMPTYRGKNCTHTWHLEADLDIPWGKDLKQETEIFVR